MSERKNNGAGLKRFARNTVSSTKRLARIAKLNLSIADEKKNISKLYREIGRLYYEAHQDDPEGFFVELFQQVDSSMTAVASMEEELVNLKSEAKSDESESDITVEIEEEPADAEPEEETVEIEITTEPEEPSSEEPEQT